MYHSYINYQIILLFHFNNCDVLWKNQPLAILGFGHGSTQILLWSSMVKEPGSKTFPNLKYGQTILYMVSRNGAFCTYITQRSMFLYTLHITPRSLRHNEFARKNGDKESASTAGRRY